MEVLKEVLIKECSNSFHDKVAIVENIPKKFFYQKTVRMVQRYDAGGFPTGILLADPEGEMEDTLHPGLEFSAIGDGGILFWGGNAEALQRLKDIDRYIEGTLPRDVRIEKRIDNTQQVGNPSAGPLMPSQLPRVSLPLRQGDVIVPMPPKASIKTPVKKSELIQQASIIREAISDVVSATTAKKDKHGKRVWSEEARNAARERIMKMHENRRKKLASV